METEMLSMLTSSPDSVDEDSCEMCKNKKTHLQSAQNYSFSVMQNYDILVGVIACGGCLSLLILEKLREQCYPLQHPK